MTRVRPSIRRLARVVLPILILIGAWQVWDNIEARRLEAEFARIRPFISEARPTGNRAPAIEETAGRFYAAAAAVVQVGDGYLRDDLLYGLVVRMRDALRTATAPLPEDISRSDAALARNEATLQLLDRGAALPFTVFPAGTEFSYRASNTVSTERVAALATLDALRKQNAPAAAHWLVNRLQLLRTISNGSIGTFWGSDTLSTQSTDLALLLALEGTSESELQRLDAGFANAFHSDDLRHFIAGYAASRYDFVAQATAARSWQYGHTGILLRPLLAHRVVTTLATAADALAIAERPWPERLAAMNSLQDRSSIVQNVFLPYPWWQVAEQIRQTTTVVARCVVAARTARVALAADAYRRRIGRLPDMLSELALDREWMIDPFSGRSLLYRASAAGFIVYSVGDNGRDDGGNVDVQLTKGAMPGRGERLDIGLAVTYGKRLR